MLIFDEKLLIVILGALILGMIAKFTLPQIQGVGVFDFLLTIIGGLGLTTYMHFIGYIDGYREGFEDGKATMY